MNRKLSNDEINRYGVLPRERTTYPRTAEDFADLAALIDDFILAPGIAPFFDRGSRIFTQGSCFAANIHQAFQDAGYASYYNDVKEALNSPLANLAYMKDLLGTPGSPVLAQLAQADVFVLTIGVAPCWFRRADGAFVFQPDLRRIGEFQQRTISVEEAREAIKSVLALVAEVNPKARVVLTLSPVPLARTFEFPSAVVADAVSKSVLRAAIHEAIGLGKGQAIYFPSFEVVRWAGGHRGAAFGADDGLTRHVSLDYVKAIVAAFIRHYGR